MSSYAWSAIGKAKLQSSGLSVNDGNKLGMYEHPSAKQLADQFEAQSCLVIPYFGVNGLPLQARPKWPDFYRIRYLGETKTGSFKDASDAKAKRYTQPANTGVAPYFPKLVDWRKVAKDVKQDIIITEGELKAAAATLAGFPTIGLGGVWNFKSTREGVFFLPELEKINWSQRGVYICYDSDYHEKPQICQAMNALGEELFERGADVMVLALPDVVEDGKTGLDDFLLERDPDELEELMAQSEPITLSRPLWRINREVVYVENPGLVVATSSGQKMSPSNFKEHSRWATMTTPERTVNKDGEIGMKKVNGAAAWLKWPCRSSAPAITYAPGKGRFTEEGEYNQWAGWGVEPKPGDVSPFLQLVDFIFEGAEPGAKEWFLDWCAYPLQNPGVKMFTSVLIHGTMEGTGKSFLGYTLGRIYGQNFAEITDKDLQSGYTVWAENKQFILGDEITGSDKREHSDMLKRLITQRSITINAKYVPQYTLPDCINYYFTSNHPDAFFMSDNDRRYFISEVIGAPLPQSFYKAYDKWHHGDGPAHLFDWFLKRKIKDFSPSAPAFRTAAKDRMVVGGKSELGAWINELKEHPEQVLRFGQMRHARDLFTSKELLDIYKAEHPDAGRVSAVGLGRALATAGFPQMDNGQPLRGADGKMGRYFAVRNVAVWRKSKDRKAMERNIALPPVRGGK